MFLPIAAHMGSIAKTPVIALCFDAKRQEREDALEAIVDVVHFSYHLSAATKS